MKDNFACLMFLVFLVAAMNTQAQEPSIAPYQVYGEKDGMAMYYDVVVPAESNGHGIILLVSGGWLSGDDNLNMIRPFWEVLLHRGYTLFQLYHPGMPTYKIPEAFEGVEAGVRHILENAGQYGIEEQKLGLIGVSSGGHLALLAAYTIEDDETEFRLSTVVALMPPTDLEGGEFDVMLFGASPMDFDPALIPSLSPIEQVDPDDPPTLLIHGRNDEAVNYERNSVRLLEVLQNANVPSKLVSVDAGHEIYPQPIMSDVQNEFLTWFDTYLQ
ncbi:MAG: alpha/beta hydrolase [Pseudohongiellaceae bacterium]